MKEKTQVLRFRCSADDKARIEEYAKKSGLGVSDYLRALALQGVVVSIRQEVITRPVKKIPHVIRTLEPRVYRDGQEVRFDRKKAQ